MRALNCKRAAGMMSLYVAGDLGGEPERKVAAHVAACDPCRRLARKFSESNRLLTEACRPPEFSAEFFSGIRESVLAEIKRDRMRSQPSRFRPRWLYATAFAAVVIASAVMLQHFRSITRQPPPSNVAVAPPVEIQTTSGQVAGTNSAPSGLSSNLPQSPRNLPRNLPRTLNVLQPRRVQSQKNLALATGRSGSRHFETVRKPGVSVTTPAARSERTETAPAEQSATSAATNASPRVTTPKSAAFPGSASSVSGRAFASQVSRIEIQTADPNIRIIWLGPRASLQSDEINHDQDQHENGSRR